MPVIPAIEPESSDFDFELDFWLFTPSLFRLFARSPFRPLATFHPATHF